MATIKDMLRAGNIDEAANTLFDGVFRMISAVPGLEMTKDEFKVIAPTLSKKVEDPSSVTNDPIGLGDGVKLTPSTGELVIEFVGPRGDGAFEAPETYKRTYSVGDEYVYEAPVIPGYVASPSDVAGSMDTDGVHLVISYSKESNPPLYGTVSIINGKREIVTDKGTIVNPNGDEVWVYYEGEMDWNRTVSDVTDEENNQWMAGFRIDAPAALKEDSDFAGVYMELVKDDGTSNSGRLLFMDTLNAEQKTGHYNNIWLLLDQAKMQAAYDAGTVITWTSSYDWNADNGYEQVVHLVVDPKKVTLAEHEGQAWPQKEAELEQVKVEPVKVEEVPKAAKKSKKKKEAEKAE